MSMADGAPLEERAPFGVTYLVEIKGEDGAVTIAQAAFAVQEEAVKYCGTDSRLSVKPVLMFGSASSARKWNIADAKKLLLATLTPAQRVILGYQP